jgi:hypothetical protein
MKIMIRIFWSLAAIGMLAAPVVAGDLPVEKINVSKLDQSVSGYNDRSGAGSSTEDRQMELQKEKFMQFAEGKIREMNRNHILSRSRMQINRGPDGLYRALFHEIDDTTLTCQVSRSQSRSIPYVAVLSYQERVYSASCATPDDCRKGQFLPVEVIPNRHIFVYNNGSWQ